MSFATSPERAHTHRAGSVGVVGKYRGEEGERSWPPKCSLHHAQSPASEEMAVRGTQAQGGSPPKPARPPGVVLITLRCSMREDSRFPERPTVRCVSPAGVGDVEAVTASFLFSVWRQLQTESVGVQLGTSRKPGRAHLIPALERTRSRPGPETCPSVVGGSLSQHPVV